MNPFSLKLREQVMRAYSAGGLTIKEIARRYHVGEWWIYKLKRQQQKLRTLAPLKGNVGKPRKFQGQSQERLERCVLRYPKATLDEIRESIDVSCSRSTIHNTLRRLGYRLQKSGKGRRTWLQDVVAQRNPNEED